MAPVSNPHLPHPVTLPLLTHLPPQRSHPLPQAATESAREARKSFFCTLCQKGYARQPEFEAHENSYDHQHRKRLKEMLAFTELVDRWYMQMLKVPRPRLVALIKPQFEVGKGQVGKGGVVRDAALHQAVCARISRWLAEEQGWRVRGVVPSPITGPKGNREFLVAADR